MKIVVLFSLLSSSLFAQVVALDHLGQTPGGSAFNLNYDAMERRLFVGCGASIWVYDMSIPDDAEIIAARRFLGLTNEMILVDDILFAAITHDGLWALDAESDTLRTISHFPTTADSAAYDIDVFNDTIYLADGYDVIVLSLDEASGFSEVDRFSEDYCKAMTVARRENLVAAGYWCGFSGKICIYSADDVSEPLACWSNSSIYDLQDIQFADRNDSIIYVCGGSNNLGLTGQFYALQYDGDSLFPVAHYTISGFPGLCSAEIINMDSRNDTLFLATTAGMYGLSTDIPVIDATMLPDDSIEVIGHIRPGL